MDSIGPLLARCMSCMQTLDSEGSMDPIEVSGVLRAHFVNSVKVCSCSGFGSFFGWMALQQNRWFDILTVWFE